MLTQKYLCMYRGAPSQNKPSPAQMQEMFAAFNAWKETFKHNILDIGSQLKPSGKVVTASGVTDGPFAEAKEIVGGFMITNTAEYATKMRSLMNHGRDTIYYNIDADDKIQSSSKLFTMVDRRFSFA